MYVSRCRSLKEKEEALLEYNPSNSLKMQQEAMQLWELKEKLRLELDTNKADLATATSRTAMLESDLAALREAFKQQEVESQKQTAQSRSEIEALELRLHALSMQLADAEKHARQLSNDHEHALRCISEQLTASLQEHSQTRDSFQQQSLATAQELASRDATVASLTTTVESLKEQLANQTGALAIATKMSDARGTTIAELQQQLADEQQLTRALTTKLEQLSNEHETKIAELEHQTSQREQELAHARQDLQSKSALISQLESEKGDSVSQLSHQIADLSKSKQELETKVTELEHQASQREQELAHARQDLQSNATKITELESTQREHVDSIGRLSREIEERRLESSKSKQELEDLRAEIANQSHSPSVVAQFEQQLIHAEREALEERTLRQQMDERVAVVTQKLAAALEAAQRLEAGRQAASARSAKSTPAEVELEKLHAALEAHQAQASFLALEVRDYSWRRSYRSIDRSIDLYLIVNTERAV